MMITLSCWSSGVGAKSASFGCSTANGMHAEDLTPPIAHEVRQLRFVQTDGLEGDERVGKPLAGK